MRAIRGSLSLDRQRVHESADEEPGTRSAVAAYERVLLRIAERPRSVATHARG